MLSFVFSSIPSFFSCAGPKKHKDNKQKTHKKKVRFPTSPTIIPPSPTTKRTRVKIIPSSAPPAPAEVKSHYSRMRNAAERLPSPVIAAPSMAPTACPDAARENTSNHYCSIGKTIATTGVAPIELEQDPETIYQRMPCARLRSTICSHLEDVMVVSSKHESAPAASMNSDDPLGTYGAVSKCNLNPNPAKESLEEDSWIVAEDLLPYAMQSGPIPKQEQESPMSVIEPEIQHQALEIGAAIGHGNYGSVHRAKVDDMDVVVKFPEGKNKAASLQQLRNEQKILSTLPEHSNIVQYHGAIEDVTPPSSSSSGPSPALVFGYASHGDLETKLRDPAGKLTILEKLQVATDIAAGIAHLHHHEILHRDLAARNILLEKRDGLLRGRIGDFGMAREETSYFEEDPICPVKWLSPEAILDCGHFSQESDIWAFGVTLWEIFSDGATPYPNASMLDAATMIVHGERLPISKEAPWLIRQLIKSCWREEPEDRPTAAEVHQFLTRYIEGNIK